MELKEQELDKLYQSYGFKKIASGYPNVAAYSLQTGHFLNADIIPLQPITNLEKVRKEYVESGYACTIREYDSIEEADEDLFLGFFAAKSSRCRLNQEYQKYSGKISSKINLPYEYIPTPYEVIPTQTVQDVNLFPQHLDLLSHIIQILNSNNGPSLILLEAAAGFGKTCTAYETIKRLIEGENNKVPIITELSRNRAASIFRYVLLDEIDLNFPTLSSNLVKSQIQKGRIPVIIDGFDELIRKKSEKDEKFEDAEPMLETISDLLSGQAKVILTTRRSAVFTDDEFYNWVEAQSEKFQLFRFTIHNPTIRDWLPANRLEQLKNANIPLNQLSNPVLLSYLRSLNDDKFMELCKKPDSIVVEYLERLLDREKERQDIKLSIEEQKKVFLGLAEEMAKNDFSAETKDFIQMVILERNEDVLSRCRLLYSSDQRPTLEELAQKLSNHALLDRKGGDDQRIGFINDFILGTLVGENILNDSSKEWCASEFFFDSAVTAFLPRSNKDKKLLWNGLSYMAQFVDSQRRFFVDYKLTGTSSRDINGDLFELLELEQLKLGDGFTIADTNFHDCIFKEVEFHLDYFSNVTFSCCKFFDCKFLVKEKSGIVFPIACEGNFRELEKIIQKQIILPVHYEPGDSFERIVLERFWPKGKAHFIGRKALRTLYLGIGHTHRKEISTAIENLRRKELLLVFSGYAELNNDQIATIREMLGRLENGAK